MKTIELKELIGKHELTGVDTFIEPIKQHEWDEHLADSQGIKFCLDGVTYLAMEDPSDGYRSMMQECYIVDEKPKNTFISVAVYGIMKPKGYNENNTIQFYDTKSNKIILEVGTDDSDDYYPSFVASWMPENMYINQLTKE